jgi:pimeloyl-ACP methyl ester carboxylesterase
MPTAAVDGITLDYEERGDTSGATVLLIAGLGSQRIRWPVQLLEGLADRGLRVVTFDNRDAGRSTILDQHPVTGSRVAAAVQGEDVEAPYTLADMAADTVGLLDHLGVDRAHLVGMSMGGMIAQHVAFTFGERVASLTSMMSSTGSRDVGQGTPEATAVLFRAPPGEREAFIADSLRRARVIGTRSMLDEERVRDLAGRTFDRGVHPEGTGRQILALYGDGDRTQRLGGITAPTLVIHGGGDPLIDVSGGRATAAAIPDAELVIIDELAHDLPAPLLPFLVDLIAGHVEKTA